MISHIGLKTKTALLMIVVSITCSGSIPFLSALCTEKRAFAGPGVMKVALSSKEVIFDKGVGGFTGSTKAPRSSRASLVASSKPALAADMPDSPLSEIYAPIQTSSRYLLSGIAAGTIVMLAMAWLVMKLVEAPLVTVTREVEAIGRESGALRQRSSSDEIVPLTKAFNDMVAALDRKQAELQERENNFRALAETASDGMLVIRGSGSFAYGNYYGAKALGYTVEELLTRSLSDVAYPDDLPRIREKFHQIIAAGKGTQRYETRMVRRDGSVIPVEISSSLTVWREESADLVIFRDISDRKRGEEEIRKLNEELQQRVEELATANREMEAFGYSLCHDLRGPLTSIYCAAEGLKELNAEQLDETGNFFLNGICTASERMEEIIKTIHLLSRVSRSELQYEEIDLSNLVMQILLGLRMEDQKRDVRTTVSSGVKVTADLSLLKSALENLLGNAWKYTRKTSDAHIEFGTFRQDSEEVYFVRDNGAGFDMTLADRLFKPFQRLHASLEYEGSGIGLATVERIIIRHGGKLWGEGAPGKGATFYFTLPGSAV